MDEETLKKRERLRQEFEYESEEKLDHIKKLYPGGSLEAKLASEIQREHRRELRQSARIIAWATVWTAGATVVIALAALAGLYLQLRPPHTAPREAVSAPVPSSSVQPSNDRTKL